MSLENPVYQTLLLDPEGRAHALCADVVTHLNGSWEATVELHHAADVFTERPSRTARVSGNRYSTWETMTRIAFDMERDMLLADGWAEGKADDYNREADLAFRDTLK